MLTPCSNNLCLNHRLQWKSLTRRDRGQIITYIDITRLGGLSTTPLFTSFFEKSMVAEVASVAENITYGLEY